MTCSVSSMALAVCERLCASILIVIVDTVDLPLVARSSRIKVRGGQSHLETEQPSVESRRDGRRPGWQTGYESARTRRQGIPEPPGQRPRHATGAAGSQRPDPSKTSGGIPDARGGKEPWPSTTVTLGPSTSYFPRPHCPLSSSYGRPVQLFCTSTLYIRCIPGTGKSHTMATWHRSIFACLWSISRHLCVVDAGYLVAATMQLPQHDYRLPVSHSYHR
jgi:hypothetical protein